MDSLPGILRPRRRPAETGSSLVELVLLTLVALVLISSVLSSVHRHSQQRRVNQERRLAAIACRNTLEELRSVSFATLPALHGSGFDVPGPNGEPHGLNPRNGDPDDLPGEIRVVEDKRVGANVLYQVEVRITWTGELRAGELVMQALMGERR